MSIPGPLECMDLKQKAKACLSLSQQIRCEDWLNEQFIAKSSGFFWQILECSQQEITNSLFQNSVSCQQLGSKIMLPFKIPLFAKNQRKYCMYFSKQSQNV